MMARARVRGWLTSHGAALLPGTIAVALMLVWAVHDGGYDADTWYWGALVTLGVLAAVTVVRWGRRPLPRAGVLALSFFAAYVAWSFLSISWAASPGDALEGSNRALLYLLVFALMLSLPWTPQAGLTALVAFALGVGAIALVLLLRFAAGDHVSALLLDSRLATPTGYFNATSALFSLTALLGITLGSRPELPGLIRGALIGVASACLQLTLAGQSRGWLFTLPLVAILAIFIARDRLRFVAAAAIPIVAALVTAHRLLHIYQVAGTSDLNSAAVSAGRLALIATVAATVLGTVIAWTERLVRPRPLSGHGRRAVGVLVTVVVLAAAAVGTLAATHGDPRGFIVRQWNGFSQPPQAASTGSHFATIGSGRYDFWRVSLDAVVAHPIGGLGQDNFAEYYLRHRRTTEEPAWTHSLEMRLLAHTGFIGAGLFAGFLIVGLIAALRSRRVPSTGPIAAAALMPLLVWLVQGSIDWFWEMPALTGPGLGFLGAAIALSPGAPAPEGDAPGRTAPARRAGRVSRIAPALIGGTLLLVLAAVLAFPYLSVRELSTATDAVATDPRAALNSLSTAARLNPLDANPGRVAGTIALREGDFAESVRRFRQAELRDPEGWFAYLGEGLADSQLGQRARARIAFAAAAHLDDQQPAVRAALGRVATKHPLTPGEAFKLLTLVG
jgi:O-Antigen ligase